MVSPSTSLRINGVEPLVVSEVELLRYFLSLLGGLPFLVFVTSAPYPFKAGDPNCDGIVVISDVIHLINYLFLGAPPLCEPYVLLTNQPLYGRSTALTGRSFYNRSRQKIPAKN